MRVFISLKQKLIMTYIVFILIPLSILGFGAYQLSSQAMEKEISGFAEQVAVSTASSVEMYLQELEKFTLQPYYNREIQDLLTFDQGLSPLSQREKKNIIENNFSVWQTQQESVASIHFFGYPGTGRKPIYSVGYLPTDFTVEMMPWYEQFSKSSDNVAFLSLHKPFFNNLNDFTDEDKVFSIVRKIYKSTTMLEYAGYFEVDFELKDIKKMLDLVNNSKNGSFFVMDNHRQIVYATDKIEASILNNIPILSEDRHGQQMLKIGNQENIIVYSKVGHYGWTVVGAVPMVSIVSGLISVRNSLIVLGTICIGLAILISAGISHQFTKPIYRLVALIKRVEMEDFQIEYKNPPRNEIGRLIKSIIRMSRKLDETIRHLYQAEIIRKESELQALKSQINPHFLFNTLEMIKMKAELDEADSTVEMITALGKLVKPSIFRGNDFISFREEADYLKNYFSIQESRYATRFEMLIEVEEALLDCYLPKLMIQPLIENAFHHGLELKQGKGKLSVIIRRQIDTLVVQVIDDGLGISKERLQELKMQFQSNMSGITSSKKGIGLANVNARMTLYFGHNYRMEINSEKGSGTEIVLEFPVISRESEVSTYVSRHNC